MILEFVSLFANQAVNQILKSRPHLYLFRNSSLQTGWCKIVEQRYRKVRDIDINLVPQSEQSVTAMKLSFKFNFKAKQSTFFTVVFTIYKPNDMLSKFRCSFGLYLRSLLAGFKHETPIYMQA